MTPDRMEPSMTRKEARRGTGAFQWNGGGWFGGQIGGTAWMLVAGVLVLAQGSLLGLAILVCFLIPNVVGVALWRSRDRIRPYPAIQALVVVMGVCSVLTLVAFDVSGRLAAYSPGSSWSVYWILLVFPTTMMMFHLQNRSRGTKGAESS